MQPSQSKVISFAQNWSVSDKIVFAAVMLMICVDISLAYMTGTYQATDTFSLYASIYIAFMMVLLGSWFMRQGLRLASMVKDSQAMSHNALRRASRLSMTVQRLGLCTVSGVILLLFSEIMRHVLIEYGGWAYWYPLSTIWFCLISIQTASGRVVINAFQTKIEGKRRVSSRRVAPGSPMDSGMLPMQPSRARVPAIFSGFEHFRNVHGSGIESVNHGRESSMEYPLEYPRPSPPDNQLKASLSC